MLELSGRIYSFYLCRKRQLINMYILKLTLMQKKKKRVLTTDVEVKKGLNLAVRQGDQFERHKVGRRKVLFMDIAGRREEMRRSQKIRGAKFGCEK